MERGWNLTWQVSLACILGLTSAHPMVAKARSRIPCPNIQHLPKLTIHDVKDSPIPVLDAWQVFLDDIPLSDVQVATLAGYGPLLDQSADRMKRRGTWVYIGMLTAAVGTAASSAGWVLYGQDKLSPSVTLPIALGGLVVGMLGVLIVTESLQTSLEPYMAPTPEHRLSRAQMQRMIYNINRRWHERLCEELDRLVEP